MHFSNCGLINQSIDQFIIQPYIINIYVYIYIICICINTVFIKYY